MKKATKNLFTPSLLATTMLLGACGGGLYSPRAAPIYDSTPSRARHSVLNSTSTPMPRMPARPVYTTPAATPRPMGTINQPQPMNGVAGVNGVNTANARRSARVMNNTLPAMTPVTPIPPAVAKRPTAATATANASKYPVKEANEVLANHNKPAVPATPPNAANTAKVPSTTKVPTSAAAAANRPQVNPTPPPVKQAPPASNSVPPAVAKATAPKTPAQTGAPAAKKAPTATQKLLEEANTAVRNNQLGKAASALERAHRINPRNATILYDIAQVRYAQGKYAQAESFASKAAAYASNSPTLAKKIWRLLAKARKASGNASGAASALKKAANL